jgi:uncharacterized protein
MLGEVECERLATRTSLLVIQPTPFCNIDCAYCYLPNRNDKKRLTLEVAERLFERLFKFPTIKESVDLVWHAGEPMVLPVSYYEEMFTLVQRIAGPNLQVRQSFQTNATLISDAWCELIKKWKVNLGLSIDGPPEFHDLNRKYRNGKGSFAAAYRGLQLVQKHGLPYHLISVLTMESLQQPDKMFDFFEREGIKAVSFNIEEKEGGHSESELAVDTPRFVGLYRSFLKRFFELAAQRRPDMIVREFETAFNIIRGYGDKFSNTLVDPFGIVSVDCEGNLSTFSPELLGLKHGAYETFDFGNVLEDDFHTIERRVAASKLSLDIDAGVRKCEQECQYFKMCGGGAPANKIYENNSANSTLTTYCRAHQINIDVMLDMIERAPEWVSSVRDRPKPDIEMHLAPI